MKRRGRLGEYLAADDYTGAVKYASKLKKDYWGNLVENPLERNKQELVKAMNDPQPLPWVREADYEVVTSAMLQVPTTIGNSTVRRDTSTFGAAVMAGIYGTR